MGEEPGIGSLKEAFNFFKAHSTGLGKHILGPKGRGEQGSSKLRDLEDSAFLENVLFSGELCLLLLPHFFRHFLPDT